jgi:SAM-dependent methyltransferase
MDRRTCERAVAEFALNERKTWDRQVVAETQVLFNWMQSLNHSPDQLAPWEVHRLRLFNTAKVISDNLTGREQTVVDLGSNMIFLPLWKTLTPYAHVIFGMDPDQVSKLRAFGHELEAFDCDFETQPLPLQGESVDLVTMFEVFEHFYIDPMYALIEVNRILKPGGKVILTAPNSVSWKAVLRVLTLYHPYQYGVYAGPGSRRHVHEPAPRDLAIALESAGFTAGVSTINNFVEPSPTIMRMLTDLGFPAGDLRGDTCVAVGEKTGAPTRRYPSELYDIPPHRATV